MVGPAALVVALAATAAVALLGPSAAEPPLGRSDNPATPPWHLDAHPGPWLVTVLLVIAVLAGLVTVGLGLRGLWRPRLRVLLASGLIAAAGLSVLPPIGSADTLSYAAYGRMATVGLNPWTTTPRQLAATGDPVGAAVEVPWQDTPSVYGPLAEGEQALASELAGRDVALTVLLFDLVGGLAFLGTGLALHRAATTNVGRRRAAVLWTANPLLWLQLVAGAHLDVLVAALGVAAVLAARRSRVAAGALAGLATLVKAPAGLVVLALAWAYRPQNSLTVTKGVTQNPSEDPLRHSQRGRWAAAAAVVVTAVMLVAVGYAIAGAGSIHQLSRASHLVSLGTPWRPVADVLDPLLGFGTARRIISLLSLVLLVVLVDAIRRRYPQLLATRPATATATATDTSSDTGPGTAFALSFAYVLAAAYCLPWYDALPWALLPLVLASRLDWLLLAHTAVLSLAYVPGRAAVALTGPLHVLTVALRDVASPVLILLILVWLFTSRSRPTGYPQVW